MGFKRNEGLSSHEILLHTNRSKAERALVFRQGWGASTEISTGFAENPSKPIVC
jgi:hypothetical protein